MDSKISNRQLQVLVRLDQRIPIKSIAGELGISESRVNQHIRALKVRYDVNDLSSLVAAYRESHLQAEGYRKPAYRNSQLLAETEPLQDSLGSDTSSLKLSDAHRFEIDAPWVAASEPSVVPGVLDGKHAIVRRLILMFGLSVGLVATIVLSISAARSIGDALESVAFVPDEKNVAG